MLQVFDPITISAVVTAVTPGKDGQRKVELEVWGRRESDDGRLGLVPHRRRLERKNDKHHATATLIDGVEDPAHRMLDSGEDGGAVLRVRRLAGGRKHTIRRTVLISVNRRIEKRT
jgi:hypothetical protein